MASRSRLTLLVAGISLALAAPARGAEEFPKPPTSKKRDMRPLPASEKAAWVHGPYAAGDCSICHVNADPKKPGPVIKAGNDLCFDCHDEFKKESEIKKSYAKHPTAKGACTGCHSPHNARKRKLLL